MRRSFLNHFTDPLVSAVPTRTANPNLGSDRGPRAGYFPNVVLRTHEGKAVRFYDDLIKGKIVVINFMYANCTGICPAMTMNLMKVQEALGGRVGRDIFMYSITLKPQEDDSVALKHYVEMHGIKPGWLFLTGSRRDVEALRRKLGFTDPDPVLDRDSSQHIGVVKFGNEAFDRWAACPALTDPDQIVKSILWMDVKSRTGG